MQLTIVTNLPDRYSVSEQTFDRLLLSVREDGDYHGFAGTDFRDHLPRHRELDLGQLALLRAAYAEAYFLGRDRALNGPSSFNIKHWPARHTFKRVSAYCFGGEVEDPMGHVFGDFITKREIELAYQGAAALGATTFGLHGSGLAREFYVGQPELLEAALERTPLL